MVRMPTRFTINGHERLCSTHRSARGETIEVSYRHTQHRRPVGAGSLGSVEVGANSKVLGQSEVGFFQFNKQTQVQVHLTR
jgi:hypothetical protein